MDNAYKLKKEYSASGVPTFIADEELNILWKNSIDGYTAAGLPLEPKKTADIIFRDGAPDTGLVTRLIEGEVCTFNVIKRSCDEKYYYIIELISMRGAGGTASAAARGYIGYVCSKIKTAARDITSVTDRLFDDISEGRFGMSRAAECFDRIYETVAALEGEAGYPDRIYSLIDPEKPDDIIILDKEMTAVAEGIKASLKGKVRISEDYDRDIFFRMNADSFETAVASMAAECCGEGSCPERIILSARRSGRDRAEITLMSLDISGSPQGKSGEGRDVSPLSCWSGAQFNKKLLSEYIYDILGSKNGAMFTKGSIPGGLVCRMNIEALPRERSVFAEKPVDGSGRQYEIADKLAFFFGELQNTERRRYTSRDCGGYCKAEGRSERIQNNNREDIENEKSKN